MAATNSHWARKELKKQPGTVRLPTYARTTFRFSVFLVPNSNSLFCILFHFLLFKIEFRVKYMKLISSDLLLFFPSSFHMPTTNTKRGTGERGLENGGIKERAMDDIMNPNPNPNPMKCSVLCKR